MASRNTQHMDFLNDNSFLSKPNKGRDLRASLVDLLKLRTTSRNDPNFECFCQLHDIAFMVDGLGTYEQSVSFYLIKLHGAWGALLMHSFG